MNVASFVCNVAIGLWLVPYLVKHLGVAAYGLVPLAMAFTEYVSVITQSFNQAVSRFLTVELRGLQQEGAATVFNSSLALMLALSLLQVAAGALVLVYLDRLIEVPAGLLTDTAWLFALTFAGFIASMLGGVFNVSMYSKNRLDLMRLNDMVRLLVRVAVTVLLFTLFGPSLLLVGVGNLLAGLCALVLSVLQWRQLSPELCLDLRRVERSRLRPIAGMAGWVIVNTVGYLLFVRIDIYIVNQFIGPQAGGEYAAVLQWNQLVRTAAGVFSGVITPLGMIYYARGELEKLSRMMSMAVKVMSLALALPLALLCAFSPDILALWLGEQFRALGGLMTLQLCTLVINLGVLPLFSINMAANRVKAPAVLTIIMAGFNVALAILFVKQFALGYYGVALAGLVVLTLKNGLFTPWYAARVLSLGTGTFFRPLSNSVLAFLLLYGGACLARSVIAARSLAGVGATVAALFALSLFPMLWLGLDREERSFVVQMAPQRLRAGCRRLLLLPASNALRESDVNQEILTKRVLFCGYYGMNNVGDDCFGSVLTWGARNYWGTAQPLLLSNRELPGPVRTRAACSSRRLFRGQIILESYWQLLRASCVVWGGGSIFHSRAPAWTPKHLSFVAARLGITPAGAIGVSLGPYRNAEAERGVRDYLGRLQFLTVRDQASYQNACAMGLPYRPVLAADLALLLPRMLPEVAGPDPGDQILGITICHYERYRGQSLENEARRERVLLEALEHLVARGFSGTFRFFVFNGHRVNGDQEVTAQLAGKLKESGARVEVVPYLPDPIAVWSQVAQCRAMVSTRLHGAIYAAAAAVPCCLIEYHRKCSDFMADAGVDAGWRIGDADCSSRELGEKLIALLSAAPESFYPNRDRLIAMAERNFTFQ